jgi:hypothetical protein
MPTPLPLGKEPRGIFNTVSLIEITRYDAFTVVLLKVKVFWDVGLLLGSSL